MNEDVLTPKGFVKMKDVKIGDEILTQSGNKSTIIGVHPQGKVQLWDVKTNDGISVKCCGNHIWKVNIHSKSSPVQKTLTTDEMIDLINSGVKLSIPMSKPQHMEAEYDSYIHPYIIGFLIGDGGTTSTISFTTADEFIVEKVKSLLPDDCNVVKWESAKYGYDITNTKHDEKGFMYSDFKNEIARLNLNCRYDKKRIPEMILNGSYETRLQCLHGLMDSDGYVDARGHCSFAVCNERLAEDFMFLVRSFGAKASINLAKKYCTYKGEKKYSDSYIVHFNMCSGIECCTLPRKRDRLKCYDAKPRLIESIADAGVDYAQCITIDDPTMMFVTNGFLPTHNSYTGCTWIAISCIRFPGIRAVLARLTLKSLKASTLNTFFTILRKWGLKEDINYKYNPVDGIITFWNGSTVSLIEMADTPSDPDFQRFGSSEYTIAFVDEAGELCEKSVDILASRLRWNVTDTFVVSKLLMSCNPSTNFLRERFVCDCDGNPAKLNKYEYYVPFKVTDNPDPKFRREYEAKLRNIKDPATRERLLHGNWLYVSQNDSAFYDGFNGDVHIVEKLKETCYSPSLPVILSFDFNTAPYMTCEYVQIDFENKQVNFLEEFIGLPNQKNNNSPKFARMIKDKPSVKYHDDVIVITGDPSGKASSTKVEENVNDFTIIQDNMKPLKTKVKTLAKQPPTATRGEWINRILADEYDGWKVRIDSRCRRLIDDLTLQKKDSTGGKEKKKVLDSKLGIRVEQYGHASDCFDYALCTFISDSWMKYRRGGQTNINVSTTPVRTAWQE